MRTYFVTGATGAIGAALVPLLLSEPHSSVRLLIRAHDQKRLDERLGELLSFWGVPAGADTHGDRIKAYRGDVSVPFFGLSKEEYGDLTAGCSHIVHSAGNVRMNLPLDEARRCAVDAARNIVLFARDCQRRGVLEKLEFVSTVGVGGRMRGVIPESWISEPRLFHNTYEEAKAEAEVFIRERVESGLPATVHRPSMVIGDSVSGKIIHFQVFYHLCEFLSGSRTFGVLPRVEDSFLDLIPVDYVARVISWSSRQKSTVGRILHLCSGAEESIGIGELRTGVRDFFSSRGRRIPGLREIPLGVFQSALPLISLFVAPRMRRAIRTLPLFLDYLAERQSFANENTRSLLAAEGIELPRVRERLVGSLEYYLSCRAPK